MRSARGPPSKPWVSLSAIDKLRTVAPQPYSSDVAQQCPMSAGTRRLCSGATNLVEGTLGVTIAMAVQRLQDDRSVANHDLHGCVLLSFLYRSGSWDSFQGCAGECRLSPEQSHFSISLLEHAQPCLTADGTSVESGTSLRSQRWAAMKLEAPAAPRIPVADLLTRERDRLRAPVDIVLHKLDRSDHIYY